MTNNNDAAAVPTNALLGTAGVIQTVDVSGTLNSMVKGAVVWFVEKSQSNVFVFYPLASPISISALTLFDSNYDIYNATPANSAFGAPVSITIPDSIGIVVPNLLYVSPTETDSSRLRLLGGSVDFYGSTVTSVSSDISGQTTVAALYSTRNVDLFTHHSLARVAISAKDAVERIPIVDGAKTILGPDAPIRMTDCYVNDLVLTQPTEWAPYLSSAYTNLSLTGYDWQIVNIALANVTFVGRSVPSGSATISGAINYAAPPLGLTEVPRLTLVSTVSQIDMGPTNNEISVFTYYVQDFYASSSSAGTITATSESTEVTRTLSSAIHNAVNQGQPFINKDVFYHVPKRFRDRTWVGTMLYIQFWDHTAGNSLAIAAQMTIEQPFVGEGQVRAVYFDGVGSQQQLQLRGTFLAESEPSAATAIYGRDRRRPNYASDAEVRHELIRFNETESRVAEGNRSASIAAKRGRER